LNILLHKAGGDTGAWLDALVRALPEATIVRSQDSIAAPVDYALVWKPPVALLQHLRGAKAVFNLGAGVDALIAMADWPRETPLIRLEDAGMATQMSEYVAHAVLHWYRELDAYAIDQRQRAWRPRKRLDKAAFAVGILGLGLLGTRVASTLGSLGFPVCGWTRSPKRVDAVQNFTGPIALDAFLRASRVLVCMLPLTPATRGLLNRETLSRLPRGRGSHCPAGRRSPRGRDAGRLPR
jgi:glyoxylate/hydroxypyruvate reductase A